MPRVLVTMDEIEQMALAGAVVTPPAWPPVGTWMFVGLHGGGRAKIERVAEHLVEVTYGSPSDAYPQPPAGTGRER